MILCVLYSMSGHRVINDPRGHFYAATKFAVTALTEGTRNELSKLKANIRITVSASDTQACT